MKGVLVRVGIDLGTGGMLGPIFEDGTFEFIPFPDHPAEMPVEETQTYWHLPGIHGGVLANYLPPRYQNWVPHMDPEFTTPSYGDPTSHRHTLQHLDRGDYLFFHAGLQPYQTKKFLHRANYIFAYFIVDHVVDFSQLDPDGEQYKREWVALQYNFHVGIRQERDTFVVVGSPSVANGGLLPFAFPFTTLGQDVAGRPLVIITEEMESVLGIAGSVQRSTPRTIRDTAVKSLLRYINDFLETKFRKDKL